MDVPLDNITALRDDIYHGWMSSPNVRSTTDIVWTCVATLFLCVYTAVHLNIPEPNEPARWQALRRAKWVLLAIFAPELVLHSARKQWDDSRHLGKRLQQHAKDHLSKETAGVNPSGSSDSTYSIDHSGDDLEMNSPKNPASINVVELQDTPEPTDITLPYAFYAIMGGFRIRLIGSEYGEHAGKTFTLSPQAIDELAKKGFFWNVSTSSIEDKSKADNLAKVLTVLQVLWMFTQSIARKISHLPLTTLEIHTFIHAACAGIMFLLWFKKPLDVRDATIRNTTPEISQFVKGLLYVNDYDKSPSRLNYRRVNLGRSTRDRSLVWKLVHLTREDFGFDSCFTTDSEEGSFDLWSIFIVQVIYGCLHMIAWKSHFPTTLESWLWRSACIVIASNFTIFLLCIFVGSLIFKKLDRVTEAKETRPVLAGLANVAKFLVDLSSLIYAVAFALLLVSARVFIVVESLISLRSVPIGVYAAIPWANYIPHI